VRAIGSGPQTRVWILNGYAPPSAVARRISGAHLPLGASNGSVSGANGALWSGTVGSPGSRDDRAERSQYKQMCQLS